MPVDDLVQRETQIRNPGECRGGQADEKN